MDRLVAVTKCVGAALERAGVAYQVIGSFAAYLYVDHVDPSAARLTGSVDLAVDPQCFDRALEIVVGLGLPYTAVETEIRIDAAGPYIRGVVKVFPCGWARFPESTRCDEGIMVAPVADLVRMKLTSFRLKDQVHIQDMDSVGLITPQIEASLSEPLRARLAQVRAAE